MERNKGIMKVTVAFFGPLAEQVGHGTVQFEFSHQATYGDLLNEIGNRFGSRFHKRIWDSQENTFKAGILIIGEGRDLDAREAPLRDGEEIKIVPVFGGG